MIETVIADDSVKKVGIIGTLTTINSGVYQEKLSRRKPGLHYAAVPTPLLASIIEEGFQNKSALHSALQFYLSNPLLEGIDSLILACTHYPLIRHEIESFYNGRIKIFDSARVVAARLKQILEIEQLLSENRIRDDVFYVSDLTDSFKTGTELFFGKQVELKQKELNTPES
jgi:Glutamate racemase